MSDTPQPCRIFLIRHGVVAPEARNRFNGITEAPLDPDEGPRQLGRVADYLTSAALAALYASPLQRTRASARVLADRFNLTITTVPDLHEMGFGVLEGLNFTEVGERYPEEMKAWFNDLAHNRIPEAETMTEVQNRAWPALEKIAANHPGQNVAVVAHGAVNRLILARALEMDIQRVLSLSQDYAGLNVLDFFPDQVVIKGINLQPGPTFPTEAKDET